MSDRSTATTFLEYAFPELLNDEHIETRPIDPTDGKVKCRIWTKTAEAAGDYGCNLAPRLNVYFGLNPRRKNGGKKEHVTRVLRLHADVDFKCFEDEREGAIATLARFPLAPSTIVDSGGGLQATWTLVEPLTISDPEDPAIERVEAVLRRLYLALGGLDAVQDISRIFRLPGTLNHKYNPPRPVQLLELHQDRQYTIEQFEALLPQIAEPEQTVVPPWVPPTGQRAGDTPTYDEIRELLRFIPPVGDYDADWLPALAAIHSIYPGPEGVALCEEWSPGKPGEIAAKFDSFRRTTGKVATVATLFYRAKQNGWQPPRCIIQPPPIEPPPPVEVAPSTDDSLEDIPPDVLRVLLQHAYAKIANLKARDEWWQSKVAHLQYEMTQLREHHSATWAVLRNPNLKSEKVTALAVMNAVASAQSAGKTDAIGYVRIPLGPTGTEAGVSPKRVSAHITELARCGVIDKQVRPGQLQRTDYHTGEITTQYITELYVKPRGTVAQALRDLAVLDPTTADPEKKRKWGGAPTCPQHPHAGTVKRWSLHCAVCNLKLDAGETHIAPAADPGLQEAQTAPTQDGMPLFPPDEVAPSTIPAAHSCQTEDKDTRPGIVWGRFLPTQDVPLSTTSLSCPPIDDLPTQDGMPYTDDPHEFIRSPHAGGSWCCAPGCEAPVTTRPGADGRPAKMCDGGHDQALLALSPSATIWGALGG